jgi:hypothetical protein
MGDADEGGQDGGRPPVRVGVCHPFWSANAVLIQVNVGMLPLC